MHTHASGHKLHSPKIYRLDNSIFHGRGNEGAIKVETQVATARPDRGPPRLESAVHIL